MSECQLEWGLSLLAGTAVALAGWAALWLLGQWTLSARSQRADRATTVLLLAAAAVLLTAAACLIRFGAC